MKKYNPIEAVQKAKYKGQPQKVEKNLRVSYQIV